MRLLGAAMLALLTLAVGVGAARADDAPTVWESRPAWGQETAALVNAYRASLGLPALAWDSRLAAAAQWMAEDRARQCRFIRTGNRVELQTGGACVLTHQDSLGRGPLERARAFGYPAPPVGENGAVGYHSPGEALEGWKGSPGHDANQRDPSWRHIGAGVACAVYPGEGLFSRMELCFYYVMFGGQAPPPAAGAGSAPDRGPAPPSAPGPGRQAGPPAAPSGPAPQSADPCAGRQPPAMGEAITYVVQPGDTLAELAQRLLGEATRYCDLAAWNGIAPPYLLRPGQQLQVPAKAVPPQGDEGQESSSREPSPHGERPAPEPAQGDEGAPALAPTRDATATPIVTSDQAPAVPGTQRGRSAHPLLQVGELLRRVAAKLWPF